MKKWGPQFQALEEAAMVQSKEPMTNEEMKQKAAKTAKDKGAAMDGAIIYIRDEGWKELKVGCTFEIEVKPTKNKETGRWEDRAQAVNNHYVTHLGGPEPFGQMVWAKARQHNWFGAQKQIVLGDGAVWIWKLANHHFAGSRQLVDWYHATEHLGLVSRQLFDDPVQRDAWYDAQENALFNGQAFQIAQDLLTLALDKPTTVCEELLTEAGYFQNNHQRMAYATTRAAGFPIGSGMVESACKQFKARFDGPGMRWSRNGAERLLPIRAAVMSGCFDTTWAQAYSRPPN